MCIRDSYRSGIKQIGPNFVGWANYAELLKSDMITYGKNTLILWVIGFIPKIVVAPVSYTHLDVYKRQDLQEHLLTAGAVTGENFSENITDMAILSE